MSAPDRRVLIADLCELAEGTTLTSGVLVSPELARYILSFMIHPANPSAEPVQLPIGRIPLPRNEDEATAMILAGEMFLKTWATHSEAIQ